MALMRAQQQSRLATFEHSAAPAYTKVNVSLAYTQKFGKTQVI